MECKASEWHPSSLPRIREDGGMCGRVAFSGAMRNACQGAPSGLVKQPRHVANWWYGRKGGRYFVGKGGWITGPERSSVNQGYDLHSFDTAGSNKKHRVPIDWYEALAHGMNIGVDSWSDTRLAMQLYRQVYTSEGHEHAPALARLLLDALEVNPHIMEAWDFVFAHIGLGVLTDTDIFSRTFTIFRPFGALYPKTFEKLLALIPARYKCETHDASGIFAFMMGELKTITARSSKCNAPRLVDFMLRIKGCVETVFPTEEERLDLFLPYIPKLLWNVCDPPGEDRTDVLYPATEPRSGRLYRNVLNFLFDQTGDMERTIGLLEGFRKNMPMMHISWFSTGGFPGCGLYEGPSPGLTAIYKITTNKLAKFYKLQGRTEEAKELFLTLETDPVKVQAMHQLTGTADALQMFRDCARQGGGQDEGTNNFTPVDVDLAGTDRRRLQYAAEHPDRLLDRAPGRRLEIGDLEDANDPEVLAAFHAAAEEGGGAGVQGEEGRLDEMLGFTNEDMEILDDSYTDEKYDMVMLSAAKGACEPGSGFNDSTRTCAACVDGQFAAGGFVACAPHTVDCDASGRDELSPATASADAICGDAKQCTCAFGTAAMGKRCPNDGDEACIDCDDGYYLPLPSSVECTPFTDCDAEGRTYVSFANDEDDAVCGELKQCACVDGGTAAKGTACPKDGQPLCVRCAAGYGLDGASCVECAGADAEQPQWNEADDASPCGHHEPCTPGLGFEYSSVVAVSCNRCADGEFAPGGYAQCTPHTVDCEAEGRIPLTDATIEADATCGALRQCVCEAGTAAVGTECPADGAQRCATCKAGFGLTDGSCSACKTGTFSRGGVAACATHMVCDDEGRVDATAGTTELDATCGTLKVCTCSDDSNFPATGKACPQHGTEECASKCTDRNNKSWGYKRQHTCARLRQTAEDVGRDSYWFQLFCTKSKYGYIDYCPLTCGICLDASTYCHTAVYGFKGQQDALCLEPSDTASLNVNGHPIGVGCCNANGSVGTRPGCVKAVTWAEANAHCEAEGLRLCTAGELNAGAGTNKGCMFNDHHIWSSSTCATHCLSAAVSEAIDCNWVFGGRHDYAGEEPYCAPHGEQHELRCCSSTAIDNFLARTCNDKDLWVTSNMAGAGCEHAVTYDEGVAKCEARAADGSPPLAFTWLAICSSATCPHRHIAPPHAQPLPHPRLTRATCSVPPAPVPSLRPPPAAHRRPWGRGSARSRRCSRTAPRARAATTTPT